MRLLRHFCHLYSSFVKLPQLRIVQNGVLCYAAKSTKMYQYVFWQHLPVTFHVEINLPSSLRIARSICFIIGNYDEG